MFGVSREIEAIKGKEGGACSEKIEKVDLKTVYPEEKILKNKNGSRKTWLIDMCCMAKDNRFIFTSGLNTRSMKCTHGPTFSSILIKKLLKLPQSEFQFSGEKASGGSRKVVEWRHFHPM